MFYFILSKFCPTEWNQQPENDESEEVEKEKESWIKHFLKTIRNLPWRFWVICLADMFANGALWPFVAFSPDFFYHHYGLFFIDQL